MFTDTTQSYFYVQPASFILCNVSIFLLAALLLCECGSVLFWKLKVWAAPRAVSVTDSLAAMAPTELTFQFLVTTVDQSGQSDCVSCSSYGHQVSQVKSVTS